MKTCPTPRILNHRTGDSHYRWTKKWGAGQLGLSPDSQTGPTSCHRPLRLACRMGDERANEPYPPIDPHIWTLYFVRGEPLFARSSASGLSCDKGTPHPPFGHLVPMVERRYGKMPSPSAGSSTGRSAVALGPTARGMGSCPPLARMLGSSRPSDGRCVPVDLRAVHSLSWLGGDRASDRLSGQHPAWIPRVPCRCRTTGSVSMVRYESKSKHGLRPCYGPRMGYLHHSRHSSTIPRVGRLPAIPEES
jgi:hypothetical protein